MRNTIKLLLTILLLVFVLFKTECQMDHRCIGIHYEYGVNLNMRYTRINEAKGHYIVEAAIPRLIAGWAGWKLDEDKLEPVIHGRYFSMRGGKHFALGNKASLGYDLLWEFTGIVTPPNENETRSWSDQIISPLTLGIAYTQSFGENFSILTIPAYGYALGKTRENDGNHHKRIAVDIYAQYRVTQALTIYSGGGYIYYPKGLATTWPYDASFGGVVFSIGIALATDM